MLARLKKPKTCILRHGVVLLAVVGFVIAAVAFFNWRILALSSSRAAYTWHGPELHEVVVTNDGDVENVFVADMPQQEHGSWEAQHDRIWETFVSNYVAGSSQGRTPPESLRRLVTHPYQCAALPYALYNRIQQDLKPWRYLRDKQGSAAVRAAAERYTSTPRRSERVIVQRGEHDGTSK